jgi:hypothetical protein
MTEISEKLKERAKVIESGITSAESEVKIKRLESDLETCRATNIRLEADLVAQDLRIKRMKHLAKLIVKL